VAYDRKQVLHVIRPRAVYSLESARAALQLKNDTLRREIRLKRLRVAKRAGRYYILGGWLLQWLRAGEITRGRPEGVLLSESDEKF
jgi:hypothetical protein